MAAELWLRSSDIATCAGIADRSVRRKLLALTVPLNGTRNLYVREVLSSAGGGTGGRAIEFECAALSRDFPAELAPETFAQLAARFGAQPQQQQLELRNQNAENIVVTADAIVIKQQSLAFSERVDLPADLARQADDRYSVLLLLDDFFRQPRGRRAVRTRAGEKLRTSGEVVAWLARQSWPFFKNEKLTHRRVPQGTIWRWWMRYRAGGRAALANRQRSDRGVSHIFGRPPASIPDDEAALRRELEKLTPAGRRVAELHFLDRYAPRACWEQLAADHARFGLATPPSLAAVVGFLASFPRPLHDRRAGEKIFHDRNAPYAVRDYTTARVMQWWVLDHAEDDFFVRNDYIEPLDRLAFPELPRDARLRMWLTAFMDVRSRFITGYAFSAVPSSTSICSALRLGVLRTGLPPQFGLLDRGEDMKKMGLLNPDAPLAHAGALARLIKTAWGAENSGIVFSIGEHPQSKPIESWFKTKRNRFDCNVPSYCGNKPANRPDICDEMLHQHDLFLAGKLAASPLPAASLAIQATIVWIEQFYNRDHKHGGHGMGGATPAQVFRAGYPLAREQSARQQLLAAGGARALDELLWDRAERVVRNECIKIYRAQYEPADDESRARLRAWNGRRVLIAADPHNLGDAIAVDPQTGERIAALAQKQFLAWGASRELIRQNVRLQRRARKAVDAMIAGFAAGSPRQPFGFLPGFSATPAPAMLEATGTDPLPPALARRAAAPLASPFVSDAVRAADFWKENE